MSNMSKMTKAELIELINALQSQVVEEPISPEENTENTKLNPSGDFVFSVYHDGRLIRSVTKTVSDAFAYRSAIARSEEARHPQSRVSVSFRPAEA